VKASVLILSLLTLGLSYDLFAGSLKVRVSDKKGGPVPNAVVYASGLSGGPVHSKAEAVIDQRNKQFVPYVTAVQAGTSILFPNSDNIRHHVYSLSPAKKFELPLYSGIPAAPVLFDKPGFVTLGCNIHDWMIAYVAVLDTPYFQVTGSNGEVTFKGLPAGKYRVEVWQPLLKGNPDQLAQSVEVTAGGSNAIAFALDLRPDFRVSRAPGLSTGGYP
jgi:plastocyanin